ncbi:hypothetical protein F183_A25450 [Bryobacterales bacterium F-183]|nr:hypothetical protein F183_A25450 [Bryobacterales bacterium F-183]
MTKNWAIVFLISSLLAALGLAQEQHTTPAAPGHDQPATHAGAEGHAPGAPAEGHAAGAEHHDAGDPMILWKWINFGILFIGLGYLAAKNLPPFFASRTAEIQHGIAEAAKLKAEAEAKAADMDKRMAQLGAEIESLRANGRKELAAEGDRIRKETADAIAKVQSQAAAEIESVTKAARQELKIYSAQLAMDLAEQRIRGKVAGGEAALVDKFIRNLEIKGANN